MHVKPLRLILLAVAISLLGSALGCDRTERIAHYRAPKPPPIDAPADDSPVAPKPPAGEPKDRTLAAILPVGSQGWFFKLTGPKDAVAAKEADFLATVKSVRFSEDAKPQWSLPEGWQQRPGSDIRYATLVIGPAEDEKPLEVSVTVLPFSGDEDAYALVNINRWRRQLQLPPISKEDLPNESTQIELSGVKSTVVNLVGTESKGGMGGGPFSRGAGDGK
jgi:hypothetical protein